MAKKSSRRASGLQRPVTPSPDLAAIVGSGPLPRSQIVSKVWDHIRKHHLQNPHNKREIIADDKLKRVFGKDRVTMFEMNKHLSEHIRGGRSEQLSADDFSGGADDSGAFDGRDESRALGDTHGSGGGRDA